MAMPGYKPTPEFAEAVSGGNLLRTRIMLKDSMVLDPTQKQFTGMLEYAKQRLPNLFVPYDGEPLEPDPTKWDLELMNQELSLLVNNFSYERISHLWRVIRKERANDIRRMEYLEKTQQHKEPRPSYGTYQHFSGSSPSKGPAPTSTAPHPGSAPLRAPAPSGTPVDEKKKNRLNALRDIQTAGETVERIMRDTARQGKKWNPMQVAQMKQAARVILDAAERYERNR